MDAFVESFVINILGFVRIAGELSGVECVEIFVKHGRFPFVSMDIVYHWLDKSPSLKIITCIYDYLIPSYTGQVIFDHALGVGNKKEKTDDDIRANAGTE